MNNYTTLNDKLLDEITTFISKLTFGMGKVDVHFIADIVNGIITNNSLLLSDFTRSSGKANIKKGVERFERHLDSFDDIKDTIENNFSSLVKPIINNRHLYFVDGGDITKNTNTKFENMGYVLDGSKEHTLAKGYKIFEIDTIDNSDQPLSLISDLSSSNSKVNDSNKELSETNEWLKRMKIINNTYGKGTFVLDRGFDGAILMQKIIEMGCDFIIRAKDLKRNISQQFYNLGSKF